MIVYVWVAEWFTLDQCVTQCDPVFPLNLQGFMCVYLCPFVHFTCDHVAYLLSYSVVGDNPAANSIVFFQKFLCPEKLKTCKGVMIMFLYTKPGLTFMLLTEHLFWAW